MVGVVEGRFQSGTDASEHVVETVEQTDPVGDEVAAVGRERSQVGSQLCGDLDGGRSLVAGGPCRR